MSDLLKKYTDFLDELDTYNQAVNVFTWDLQTAAPDMSIESKLKALSFFSTKAFEMTTSDSYAKMLDELLEPSVFEALPDYIRYAVTENKLQYERFKNVPTDFYSEYVSASARSEKVWEKAKEENDFAMFAPHLEKMIAMKKKMLAYTDPGKDPYDALLDQYEKGMTTKDIDPIFDEIKAGLKPLLAAIAAKPQPDINKVNGYYDVEKQRKVQDIILKYQGFDTKSGTTGESAHPFTMSLNESDTRVTNHYNTTEPINAMFSACHECGHALFEQNVDPRYKKTAAGEVEMMGLHESQSRLYENILGRNANYWIPIYDQIVELLPDLKKITFDEFVSIINYVHPSMIRTDADEVTYCLHIILRYEMEKAIFIDNVSVGDLPALWNDKMEELLGIRPANDAEGILQDMHWSDGSFGYFPSYLLGSVYDGMILKVLNEQLGDIDTILREGRIKEITAWLKENIHRHGALYSSKEVLKRIGAGEVTAGPLLKYFNEKYTKIYNL